MVEDSNNDNAGLFLFKKRGFIPYFGHLLFTFYFLLRDFCPKGFGKSTSSV